MKPVLIGLNGIRGSGKNTAAKFIAEWGQGRGLIVRERGFADLLKLSAARSLGLVAATNINDAVVLMDSLKMSGIINIEIPGQSLMKSISGREFLKWFGTEGHRDVFGDDFWVDMVLPDNWIDVWRSWFGLDRDPDIALITDLRFANEARRVRELGGVIWKIDRGLPPDADGHGSEQPLPADLVDLVIDNHSSLEALETNIRSEMTAEYPHDVCRES